MLRLFIREELVANGWLRRSPSSMLTQEPKQPIAAQNLLPVINSAVDCGSLIDALRSRGFSHIFDDDEIRYIVDDNDIEGLRVKLISILGLGNDVVNTPKLGTSLKHSMGF